MPLVLLLMGYLEVLGEEPVERKKAFISPPGNCAIAMSPAKRMSVVLVFLGHVVLRDGLELRIADEHIAVEKKGPDRETTDR